MPPWLIKAILIALAALLVLWILWQTLFKSTVESAARDAVEEPIAELTERVDEVAPTTVSPPTLADGETAPTGEDTGAGADGEGTGTGTEGTPTDGTGTDGTGTDGTGTDPTATTAPAFATPFGNPADFQLGSASSVPAGTTQTFSQPFSAQFSLTDLVFQNPAGDTGLITVSRDGAVLFTSALENFRDLDQHFVAPYTFASGQSLLMSVTCTTPGPGGAGCSVSASFAGFAR